MFTQAQSFRTGRTRLPKTPKRGYCFSQEAETFQKCRKKLLDSVKRKGAAIFANDGNTALCAAQTPKSSRNATARAVKQETMLAGQMNGRKIPVPPVPAPRQYVPKQQTPIKVAVTCLVKYYYALKFCFS
ncbi:Uncharacterized protein BM_BM12598 [Brugia malayi]|uniref:INCENP_ARK-bind domain-containing protein n=1 Tax=Brugia malayi TaxID=6279 RepID=A0A4E9F8H3_BRUMA|nr:Uncharacterized protein BM_BM12598 [Brugia malayi]VIO92346.1 Uncharacterized protein BM_BM12598 [Brugia malayi]